MMEETHRSVLVAVSKITVACNVTGTDRSNRQLSIIRSLFQSHTEFEFILDIIDLRVDAPETCKPFLIGIAFDLFFSFFR
jgi:hypothetical protein